MIILAIRTDSPVTKLILLNNHAELTRDVWESGRTLASTLLSHISVICDTKGVKLDGIEGVVCYEGPGSFTGLRIGITVGNTLAYSNNIPIIGTSGEDWLVEGVGHLLAGENVKILLPEYGSEANITM